MFAIFKIIIKRLKLHSKHIFVSSLVNNEFEYIRNIFYLS